VGVPRPPQIDFPDAVCHVTGRGNGRAEILRNEDDGQGFLGRLAQDHYGIGAAAVGAIHRRLADRPDVLHVVESLAKELRKTRTKLKV
jgi:hypothetical protein